MEGRGEVVILSSNNYLGLSNEPEVVAAGKEGARPLRRRHRVGALHLRHVHRPPRARGRRARGSSAPSASLSFVSCWNANEAVPGTLLGEDDLVISDQLNHASIIDGIRLAKAITKCQTGVYRHGDMADLEREADAPRRTAARRMVITDGVFSMEGAIAKLPDLVELCRRARRRAGGGRLARHRRPRRARPRHGRALRARGRGGHHHLDARQGAGRRGGRVRGRVGRGVRLPHPAGPAAALLQRAAAHRRGQRARQRRVSRGPPRAGHARSARTPATSASSSSSSASSRCRAKPRSFRSSSARPPPRSG